MLERGKVVESGTHEELMAIPNGKYAEMSRLALGEVDLDNKARTATVANDSTTQSENGTEGPFKDVRFDADEVTAINTPLPMSRASSPEPQ